MTPPNASPRLPLLMFLSAFLAAALAFSGYRDLDSHGGGNVIALLFEVILPGALALLFLGYGVYFWSKSKRPS